MIVLLKSRLLRPLTPVMKRTWLDASRRWLSERDYKRTIKQDRHKLVWIDAHLGAFYLSDITTTLLDELADLRASEGSSSATVNRYLALIRAILRAAVFDWEWLEKVPRVRLKRESPAPALALTQKQIARLYDELPEHLRAPFLFALASGLRMRNVFALEWYQVDGQLRFVVFSPDQMKAGEAFAPALSETARAVLRQQRGIHPRFVFTYRGKPMTRASNSAWYKAKRRAGLERVRWHDLRHTWATLHAIEGTGEAELQMLGGWKSRQMVKRYTHLMHGAYSRAASNIDSALGALPITAGKSSP